MGFYLKYIKRKYNNFYKEYLFKLWDYVRNNIILNLCVEVFEVVEYD